MRQLAPFLLILFLAAGRGQAAASEFLKYLEPRVEFVPNCAAPGNAVAIRTSLWTPLNTPCDCVATLTSTGDTLAARLGLVDCCQNLQFTAFYWGGGSRAVRVTRRAAGLIQCVDGWLTVGTCSRNPWTQGSGYSQGVQVVGTTPTSVEWRVTFDPKNYSAVPYTSFIGLLPVARVTGTLVGTSTTRSVLPSELDAGKAFLDPLVVGDYFLDFNEQETNPWANGDPRSNLSGVRDPVDRARSSYGGYRESYLVQDMFQESSVFARQTVTDDTLRALGLGSITIRYDVVAVVGDGPEAGTRLGYVELEFQRAVGQNARVVPVFSTLNAPPAPVEAAISQAMTAYFSAGKGFVWPLPVGAPVWGIRWGSCE